jgi:hypothetical protein
MAMDIERQRRARRWVWGCTGGCLGCILLTALAVLMAFRYYMHAVPVVPPQTFLTQDTSGFLFVQVDPKVPLTMETALDTILQPAIIQVVPTRPGETAETDRQKVAAYISSFAPLQCVLITQTAPKEDLMHGGLAVSVHSGSRLLSALARKSIETPFTSYEGADLATIDKDRHVALRSNNYMSADREELLKTWVESLKAERQREQQAKYAGQPPAPRISPALKRAYDRLDAGLPFVFATLNDHHELASLAGLISDDKLRQLVDETGVVSSDVLNLSGEIKPLNDRDVELSLLIECADSDAATGLMDRLAAAVRNAGPEWPLQETAVSVNSPNVIEVKGRVNDLPAKVAAIVADVADRVRAAHAPQLPHPPPAPPKPATEAPSVSI